jgi:hypothetical protein
VGWRVIEVTGKRLNCLEQKTFNVSGFVNEEQDQREVRCIADAPDSTPVWTSVWTPGASDSRSEIGSAEDSMLVA